jgi:hypothetical protein
MILAAAILFRVVSKTIGGIVVIASLLGATGLGEPQVKFCDLVSNPDSFNEKEVTIRATYIFAFEVEHLYCLDCLEKGRVWLEIPDDLDKRSMKVLKQAPKGAGTVNLMVQGVFVTGGSYGPGNFYRHKIVAHKIMDLVVLVKGMKPLKYKQEQEARSWCGGKNL